MAENDLQGAMSRHLQALHRPNKEVIDIQGSGKFEYTDGRRDIADFLNDIFWYAKSIGVSDVHFQSTAHGCLIRMRHSDMKLQDYMYLNKKDAQAVERRLRAQSDGSDDDFRYTNESQILLVNSAKTKMLNIRISFKPTVFGQNIVCRILREADEISLSKIEMDPELKALYLKVLSLENGLIVVSGPTGSGKTQTLMASLNELDDSSKNICTVENPVEIVKSGLNQTNVTPQISFAAALKNILRQDPDVILVGETNDEETAVIAVNAAHTGHMTLTTTHANTAAGSLLRLMQLGAKHFELADAIRCFFAQRLMKKLCPNCHHTIPAPKSRLPTRFPADSYAKLNPKGCMNCNGQGFIGRIPVFEMGFSSEKVRQAILDKSMAALQQALFEQPTYRTLTEAALELSRNRLVDFDDAVNVESSTDLLSEG
ncbi:GspE/PulE family protein [Neisseria sp.]|uniref:GspE/PulE family protein n=1 Tax=Neisseria sp. TaxID=192066 RepID=UPI00359F9B90